MRNRIDVDCYLTRKSSECTFRSWNVRAVSDVVLFLELSRRQEDLRRIDERRSQDFDRRFHIMSGHPSNAYNGPIGNIYPAQMTSNALPYHESSQVPYSNTHPFMQQQQQQQQPSSSSAISHFDAAYMTNQVAHGFDYPSQANRFDRKRPRH
jgi:hypothetical protein